jgi:hypothetical protein
MRKPIILGLILLFTCINAFSDIKKLQFSPRQFDENSYVIRYNSTTVKQLEPKSLDSQTYDFAFQELNEKYETRYILFAQEGEIEDYRMQVQVWSIMVISNITGLETLPTDISAFNDDDVSEEFNADYGLTYFTNKSKTDFTEGYQYIMINFFYKKNLGIMCHAVLFNDLTWVGSEDFLFIFHSFRFL